jgi:electron transfer flavoprotein alpha subunit
MAKGIWVFVEHKDGAVRKVAYEMLSEARKIAEKTGEEVWAVALGHNMNGITDRMGSYGADKVLLVEHESLEQYPTDGYTKALVDAIREHQPSTVFYGATVLGKDLSPRVAARLGAGLATDCTGIAVDDSGELTVTRPVYAGKAITEVGFQDSPVRMASMRPNVLIPSPPDESRKAEVVKVTAEVKPEDIRTLLKEALQMAGEKVDLTEAEVIISGGRGMKNGANFKILEEMADVLGATVGASRAAVDAGWKEQSDQVGQTGKVVSPNLYIACGISGSIQHYAGMGTSKYIVAINKDSEAPIFTKCDYGIVDDLFKVVPVLTEELKKILAE